MEIPQRYHELHPPGRFPDRGIDDTVHFAGSRRKTCPCPRRSTLSRSPWSRRRWPHAMGFIWSRDAACAETTSVRKKVNDMLASGASYAMVVRALAADNAELDKCDRVTIDSVRNHCGRHFPVQKSPKQPTERSSNAGQRRTASTSSKAWPPQSPPSHFLRPSWSKL